MASEVMREERDVVEEVRENGLRLRFGEKCDVKDDNATQDVVVVRLETQSCGPESRESRLDGKVLAAEEEIHVFRQQRRRQRLGARLRVVRDVIAEGECVHLIGQ